MGAGWAGPRRKGPDMSDQIISTAQHVVTDAVERAPLAAPAQVVASPLRGVPRQDDCLEPDPVPAEHWTDEDLERFPSECQECFDEQDVLEGVNFPICDEGTCPVSDACPFGPEARRPSDDELLDILESCQLARDRAMESRGIPGLAAAFEGAGWPVYRIGSADEA